MYRRGGSIPRNIEVRTFHRKVWQEWEYSRSSPVIHFYPLAAASFETSAPTGKRGEEKRQGWVGGGGGAWMGKAPSHTTFYGR